MAPFATVGAQIAGLAADSGVTLEGTRLHGSSENPPANPAVCNCFSMCADAGFDAADRAMQTLGGMGYSEEYAISRFFREARLMKIAPISQEMILNFLGSHVLGLARSY